MKDFKEEDILVIDAGSGTQDVLVYQAGKNIENCPKLVMPSAAQLMAGKIHKATQKKKDIYFHGHVMGSGRTCVNALEQHIGEGFKVYSTLNAAYTFNDKLEKIKKLGIQIVGTQPNNLENMEKIWLGDIDLSAFKQSLEAFDQTLPKQLAVCVQDHGYSAVESNRTLRFKLWKEFIDSGGDLKSLVFTDQIPEVYTRMKAIREIVPGAVVSDTGTAALLGIISDKSVRSHMENGILAINIGNTHTLAAAIRNNRVYGIFEHHTPRINLESLAMMVKKMQGNELTNEEVFDTGGHGAAFHPDMNPGWDYIVVTGPQREMAKTLGWYEAAPFGDMMLTGCFGLLAGLDVI